MTRTTLAIALLAVLACSDRGVLPLAPPSLDCSRASPDPQPGILVLITDIRTGRPLAEGARGAVHEGTYVDSLRRANYANLKDPSPDAVTRAAAPERPGTYFVELLHEGYFPFLLDGVMVRAGDCHVRFQGVQARMVPLP